MTCAAGDLQTLLSTHTLLSATCQSASDYLAADEELETGELPTEEDIIALVEGDDQIDDTEDDQDNHIAPPSHKQTVEAARILLRASLTAKKTRKAAGL